MEKGKAYLIHLGDWHSICGRVVEQVGPQLYRMESVSKIDTNAGDCWHELAAGNASLRKGCTYYHSTTPCIVPLSIFAQEWVGKTPQEEGL